MNNLTVIIPSKTVGNLTPCLQALERHEPGAHVVVIWDGQRTGDPGVRDLWAIQHLINDACGLRGMVLRGEQPFIFARNCNIGIREAMEDDVILLNDDATLETPGGFSRMATAAAEDPYIGLLSATTNLAGNPAQHPARTGGVRFPTVTPGNSFPTIAFVCVLIPRRTIDAVGLLDERFTAYGWEDNDYCRRVTQAGLRVGIHDGCFVDHARLQSTFRTSAYAAGDIAAGKKIYLDKWGSM